MHIFVSFRKWKKAGIIQIEIMGQFREQLLPVVFSNSGSCALNNEKKCYHAHWKLLRKWKIKKKSHLVFFLDIWLIDFLYNGHHPFYGMHITIPQHVSTFFYTKMWQDIKIENCTSTALLEEKWKMKKKKIHIYWWDTLHDISPRRSHIFSRFRRRKFSWLYWSVRVLNVFKLLPIMVPLYCFFFIFSKMEKLKMKKIFLRKKREN